MMLGGDIANGLGIHRSKPTEAASPSAVTYSLDHTWSKPVNGMAGRLVFPKTTWTVGEDITFDLVLINVSGKSTVLARPNLMPTISAPGSNPYEDELSFSGIIHA